MKFTVLETQGELSEEAVADLSSAMDTFFGSKLADLYNREGEYFQTINLIPAKQRSTEQQMNEEPVRNLRNVNRKMEGVSGTEIICHGTIEFLGQPPSSSDIIDAITLVSKEYNNDFASDIVDTGNAELSKVFIVLVEESLDVEDPSTLEESEKPSSYPSNWSESFQKDPNGIQSQKQGASTRDPKVYLMVAVGVATLATLMVVFATRRRSSRAAHVRNAAPIQNDVADRSIFSLTDYDDYIHDASLDGSQRQGYELNADIEKKCSKLPSAAEINSRGTMTLEKDDKSVIPKLWLNARLLGNSQQQKAGHGSDSSSSSDHSVDCRRGGFPGYFHSVSLEEGERQRYEVDADKINRKVTLEKEDNSVGDTSTENYSDCSRGDFARNRDGAFPTNVSKAPGYDLDWSYIGTVDEHADENDIERALSQETDESKSSLNRFISDLVWLEKKIADETENAEIGVGVVQKVADIEPSDSYSYECEEFSPRSLSDDGMTIQTEANSAMSITVRDCYVPPGKLDIDISSTKDGPVISCIGDKSLYAHFNVGDLIMAVDDRDTRSLSGEQMASTLSSRSGSKRKITLLQLGLRKSEGP